MRRMLAALFVVAALAILAIMYNGGGDVNLSGKRILMVIAPRNFRDEELLVPKEYFEERGAEVLIASKEKNICTGMLGAKIVPDLALRDVNVEQFDAVIFVGGSGTPIYYTDPDALRIAREAYEHGKVVAAICLAPGILASAGVLKGKRATVWWSPQYTLGRDLLVKNGALFVDEPLVVDGRIVTANGPGVAKEFAETIARLLAGMQQR